MGLDMYLYAGRTVYGCEFKKVGKGTKAQDNGRVAALAQKYGILRDADLADMGWADVRCCIGYWRKANAVHQFLVREVQDGHDDTGTYDVPEAVITDLRERCVRILKARGKKRREALAEKLLPTYRTVEGCCYGSTDYDDYYYECLKRTVRICDNALANSDNGCDLYYYSSY